MVSSVYISLGSNQGESIKILESAYTQIEEKVGEVIQKSSFYETQPWGFDADTNFVNSLIEVRTKLNASETLEKLQEIELNLGRIRSKKEGYESRTIDLDIITFNNDVFLTKNIEIPHPRMHLRAFVLIPLKEINPKWCHPVTNKGIEELLAALEEAQFVKRITKE